MNGEQRLSFLRRKHFILLHIILIVLVWNPIAVESSTFAHGDYSGNSNGMQWTHTQEGNHVCYSSSTHSCTQSNSDEEEEEDEEGDIKEGNEYDHILHEKNIQVTISQSMSTEPKPRTFIMDIETPEADKKKKDIANDMIATYLHFLDKHEVLTKCLTSGVIGIIGDFIAQCFEHSVKQKSLQRAFSLDRIRLFGILFESTLVSGPLMHYAYNYMEYMVPVHSGNMKNSNANPLSHWIAPSIHVLADLALLGPTFVFTMMLFTSIIEGRISTFTSEFMLDFGPALWASTIASLSFVPVQLIAFKYLPIKFRLLYMNFQDVVWNAVVSVMAHKSRK